MKHKDRRYRNGNSQDSKNSGRQNRSRSSQLSRSDRKDFFKQYSTMPVTKNLERVLSAPLAEMSCCVFDIETTGGNPDKNGITEICAFKVENGAVKGRFYSMVNPQVPIPPIVRRMTGINNKMVRNQPLIDEVMPGFLEFVGDDILVSHNTIGDLKFLRYFAHTAASRMLDNFFLCTHLLTEKLLPEAPDKSLNGVARHLNIVLSEDAHRAEADAKITFLVFEKLRERLIERQFEQVRDGVRFQEDLESAIRLGWEISDQNLAEINAKPGVLSFTDQHNKELFITSAFNCKKNLHSLQKRDMLPKSLLRTLLKSHRVEAAYDPHIFLAMLREARLISDKNLRVSPSAWHQRSVFSYCISRSGPNHYRLSVDIADKSTLFAFGPVFDKKEALELIKQIAEAVSGSYSRKGSEFGQRWLCKILDFFGGKNKRKVQNLLFSWLNPRFILSSAWRNERLEEIKVEGQLADLRPVKNDFQNLFDNHGIFVIETENNSGYYLFHLVSAVPKGQVKVNSDWKEWLFSRQEGREFQKSLIDKANQFHNPDELSAEDSHTRNASLWMLYNKKGKLPQGSIFVKASELTAN